ncbi:MAG TPA: type II toxin-antitoxin system death-on-curing family toxin [Niabella sp.]|nr:type II toxin-antitoxin system death-on-curing family toxin [Niabella sp.]
MITLETILKVHSYSIAKYGGSDGVRDVGSLESSVSRSFQTFDGVDLYRDIFEKAAALIESLIINHPFVDGNKRTGFLAMAAFIEDNGYLLSCSEDEAYNFTIKISTGKAAFNEIVNWLKNNTARSAS